MKKNFKTESKRLLDLMTNSIYTNSDIFLRELISNASDAIDKRYYFALTEHALQEESYKIEIEIDKENRILRIHDNGIGMDEQDLDDHLGTIARSGSQAFKQDNQSDDIDIIGQFGVGFYSCFMIANRIEVLSKKIKQDQAFLFTTDGLESYDIQAAKKDSYGTTITLHLKENTEQKNFDDYLDAHILSNLIKKYSDFVRYPIYLNQEIVNSMIPLWKKDKQDITDEMYQNFYKENYFDYEDALKVLHFKLEGNASYSALLFIPKHLPQNFYSNDYKLGLKLFSKSIFIKDDAKELVSDYFRFVKGVIDSDDLNLNISREILQQDHQVALIRKSLDKKIKSSLEMMLKSERSLYESFYDNFKVQLKYGCYENFGMNKDVLIDLLLFKSSKTEQYVSLKEYQEHLLDGQKDIYYATGSSIQQIKELPQMEKIIDKGYEVLYCDDQIDEFLFQIIRQYQDLNFKSVNHDELDLESENEKTTLKQKTDENQDLLTKLKEALKEKVSDVKLSNRLKSHPVCLTTSGSISLEMEKALQQLNQGDVKANRILEINPEHPLFNALSELDESQLADYAQLLYDQSLLIAGLAIEDPIAFSNRLSRLMINKK